MSSTVDDTRRLRIATDGSCRPNPGPGAWAWVTADGRSGSGGIRSTTNTEMELFALLQALRSVPKEQPVHIIADSDYAIGCASRWIGKWRSNGYRNSARKPIENATLIRALDEELSARDVTFEHVYGHRGHELNERADSLANATREEGHFGPEVATALAPDENSATLF